MASYVRAFTAEIITTDQLSFEVGQMGGEFTLSFEDRGSAADELEFLSSGSAVQLDIEETIYGVDQLTADIISYAQCMPVGGWEKPYLALQDALISDGIYTTLHSYAFTDQDFISNRWGIIQRPRGGIKHKHMEDGSLREYPYKVKGWFEVEWQNLFCLTAFLRFCWNYAYDWIATTPSLHIRRILLYPSGLTQVDRYGDLLQPVRVKITDFENFWANHHAFEGRRGGGYEGTMRLETDLYTPGQAPFVYQSTPYVGGIQWQSIWPWGFMLGLSGS